MTTMTATLIEVPIFDRVREAWTALCARDVALGDEGPPLADEIIRALRAALDAPRLPGLDLEPGLQLLALPLARMASGIDVALAQLAYLHATFEMIVIPDIGISRRQWATSQLGSLVERFMIAVARESVAALPAEARP